MTQYRPSKPYTHHWRSGLFLALAALAGLAAAAGPLQAEEPRYLTTPLCDGEAKCSMIRFQAEANFDEGRAYVPHIDRIQLYFDGTCRYELTEGGVKEVDDFTVYEVEPGNVKFTREWRVPAGCKYLIHARFSAPAGTDDIARIALSRAETAQDLCFIYDFGDAWKRTDMECK